MPYTVYDLPMQRTGFRPYGRTNPWSATQLNGVRDTTWYEHQVLVPFSEGGGRRLGQWQRAFSPRFLGGMGHAPTVCLDQNQNTIPCSDPNCTYGDCVSPKVTTPPISPGPGPRVNAPMQMFPPTAGSSSIPACASGYARNAYGQCVSTSVFSQMGPYLPVIGLVLIAALALGGRR